MLIVQSGNAMACSSGSARHPQHASFPVVVVVGVVSRGIYLNMTWQGPGGVSQLLYAQSIKRHLVPPGGDGHASAFNHGIFDGERA